MFADPHTRGQSSVDLAASDGVDVSTHAGELIVGDKYRVLEKIGSGSFGDIYLGVNVTNGEVRGDTSDCDIMAIITLTDTLSLIRR